VTRPKSGAALLREYGRGLQSGLDQSGNWSVHVPRQFRKDGTAFVSAHSADWNWWHGVTRVSIEACILSPFEQGQADGQAALKKWRTGRG
jgi:hypothetical protein